MPDMQAQSEQGDRVARHDPPQAEPVDHPDVGALGGTPGMDRVRGQMEQVVDDEERDHHPAPAQRERGVRALHAPWALSALVASAAATPRGAPSAPPHGDRRVDVNRDAEQQDDPNHPERPGIRQKRFTDRTKMKRVTIERSLTRENLEVSVHVHDQVDHHDQPGDRHGRLQRNRRTQRDRGTSGGGGADQLHEARAASRP